MRYNTSVLLASWIDNSYILVTQRPNVWRFKLLSHVNLNSYYYPIFRDKSYSIDIYNYMRSLILIIAKL